MTRPYAHKLLVIAALAVLAGGCRTAPERIPGLACTALDPGLQLSQSFVADQATLRSVCIVLKTLNPAKTSSDTITLTVLDRHERQIGCVSQTVPMGLQGWVTFAFPGPGLDLNEGERYFLRVQGSPRLSFGWCQRRNFYPHGSIYSQGVANPAVDCFFKLTWAVAGRARQLAHL